MDIVGVRARAHGFHIIGIRKLVHSDTVTSTSPVGGEELFSRDLEGIMGSSASLPQTSKWLAKELWKLKGGPSEAKTVITVTVGS